MRPFPPPNQETPLVFLVTEVAMFGLSCAIISLVKSLAIYPCLVWSVLDTGGLVLTGRGSRTRYQAGGPWGSTGGLPVVPGELSRPRRPALFGGTLSSVTQAWTLVLALQGGPPGVRGHISTVPGPFWTRGVSF